MSIAHKLFEGQGYKLYSAGVFAPKGVILDNKFETVEKHKDYLLSRGYTVLLTSKVSVVQDFFKKIGGVAVYLFDMHMRRYKYIGERDTEKGLATGVTLISDLTEDGQNHIPFVATLTEHDSEEAGKVTYKVLERNGQSVARLSKNKSFDEFKEFISLYEMDYINEFKKELLEQNMVAMELAYSELSKSSGDALSLEIAAILGYTGVDAELWLKKKNRTKIFQAAANDVKDRVETLAYIKDGLMAHFGDENVSAQQNWVHRERSELRNRSAWDHLTSGKSSGVNLVSSYVNRVLG